MIHLPSLGPALIQTAQKGCVIWYTCGQYFSPWKSIQNYLITANQLHLTVDSQH